MIALGLFFGFTGALMIGLSFAAKGGSSNLTGSCSVNPNPVAVGSQYTLTGTNLGANNIVNVLVSDPKATTAWNVLADANGTATVSSYPYNAGNSTVKIQYKSHNSWKQLAACSFSVTN